MGFSQEFIPLELDSLHREAAVMKAEGWRFMQTHAVNADDGIDLYYSFMKDGKAVNYRVAGVKKGQQVPSITDLFLAAFVFENEARELFGIDMRDIALDFGGAMYAPAQSEPMTYISPEQKAAREKAKKAAAAKAAKEAASDSSASADGDVPAKGGFVMTPERQARLDAKMATMSPDKKAKVEAALKARAVEASARATAVSGAAERASSSARPGAAGSPSEGPFKQHPKDNRPSSSPSASAEAAVPTKDAALEEKLSHMDPAKAGKVRAALEGRAGEPTDPAVGSSRAAIGDAQSTPERFADGQLEALIGLMDETKASVVRAALNEKGGE